MTKAKERALEAYPHYTAENITEVMNAIHFFAKGYEQAEKDLALTWEDVENIVHIYEIAKDIVGDYDKELYEEVLTRFKQFKED